MFKVNVSVTDETEMIVLVDDACGHADVVPPKTWHIIV